MTDPNDELQGVFDECRKSLIDFLKGDGAEFVLPKCFEDGPTTTVRLKGAILHVGGWVHLSDYKNIVFTLHSNGEEKIYVNGVVI